VVASSLEPSIWKFHVVIWQTTSQNSPVTNRLEACVRNATATHAYIVKLDRKAIFKVKSSCLSRHHCFLPSQAILACFAIALWVHSGPIPRHARAARLFFLIQPIRSLFSDVVVFRCSFPWLNSLLSKARNISVVFYDGNLTLDPNFQVSLLHRYNTHSFFRNKTFHTSRRGGGVRLV